MPPGGVATGTPADVARSRSRPGPARWSARPRAPGQAATAISYFLVSGGRRYALASKSVAGMLGYDLSPEAVLLPAGVVDLIPPGPALDPAAAARPVAVRRMTIGLRFLSRIPE